MGGWASRFALAKDEAGLGLSTSYKRLTSVSSALAEQTSAFVSSPSRVTWACPNRICQGGSAPWIRLRNLAPLCAIRIREARWKAKRIPLD
jgi:hypothetical protein